MSGQFQRGEVVGWMWHGELHCGVVKGEENGEVFITSYGGSHNNVTKRPTDLMRENEMDENEMEKAKHRHRGRHATAHSGTTTSKGGKSKSRGRSSSKGRSKSKGKRSSSKGK